MDLASTNEIDQRRGHAGSRTDREIDDFAFDEPKRRELPEHRPIETSERAEELLRQRLRRHGSEDPSASKLVFMAPAQWRR